jgi:hypothetical protein
MRKRVFYSQGRWFTVANCNKAQRSQREFGDAAFVPPQPDSFRVVVTSS